MNISRDDAISMWFTLSAMTGDRSSRSNILNANRSPIYQNDQNITTYDNMRHAYDNHDYNEMIDDLITFGSTEDSNSGNASYCRTGLSMIAGASWALAIEDDPFDDDGGFIEDSFGFALTFDRSVTEEDEDGDDEEDEGGGM